MKKIYLDETQKKVVLEILNRYFPKNKYFIFGSRATGLRLKPFSDLDIAIEAAVKVDDSILSNAQEAFSSSNLPFKVDLVDVNSIPANFLSKIKEDFVLLE